jgi:hypothetical protein
LQYWSSTSLVTACEKSDMQCGRSANHSSEN